jgi:hypothetical protein
LPVITTLMFCPAATAKLPSWVHASLATVPDLSTVVPPSVVTPIARFA